MPQLINYQGRVAVGTVNFDGTGQFKFALVNGSGSTTYWSNDGTSTAGSQPTAAVSLTVTKGLYSVLLGDQGVTNMTAIPSSVFANGQLRLRVWFDDGANGFQRLTPDQRLAPTAYLSDGAVTTAKLANGAVGSAQLAPGALLSSQRVTGTTQLAQANGSYTATDAARVTITLPATANIGDTVRVLGAGSGGWSIAPNSGQSVLGIGAAAGVSWTPHGPAKTWVNATSSADGNKLVAAAQSEYLYASADGGNNWNQLTSAGSREWKAVASSADGSKLFGVVVYGFLYTSTDSGATWTPRLADQTRSWLAGASSADGTKLVAVADGDRIYTSSDSGATWTQHGVSAPYKAVASSSDGSILVAVANFGQIYTSTDSGMNWTVRESERAWFSVACSASGTNIAAVVHGGQIYTSADSGVTWTPRETSRLWECVAASADGSTLVAGVDNNDYLYVSKGSLPLTGEQGSTAELQYLGNGQWQSVQQSLIATGAVGAAQIASGAVSNTQLAANAVQAANIAAGAVGASQLANGSVGAAQLAPAAITAANIAPGAIGSAQIAPNALTGANFSVPFTITGSLSKPLPALPGAPAPRLGTSLPYALFNICNYANAEAFLACSTDGTGVYGKSTFGSGVIGDSDSAGDWGVFGDNTGGGTGVYGRAEVASATKAGVVGENTAAGGTGIIGRATKSNSAGVAGIANTANTTGGVGVYGRGSLWAGKFDGDVFVNSAFLKVQGAGDEQVYIGGDGNGGEAEIGSLNANTTKLIAWN